MAGAGAAAGRVELQELRYAGIATRGIALTLDVLIAQAVALFGYGALIAIAAVVTDVSFGDLGKLLAASGWVITIAAYFVAFWALTGQTPGMKIMRIRVMDSGSGQPPRFLRAVARVMALGLCVIPLFAGFLPVLFDARRRGVHDMVVRTVVVYEELTSVSRPAASAPI